MTANRGDITVLVLGNGGRPTRRVTWSRGRSIGVVLVGVGALAASLATGYWLGRNAAPGDAVASLSAAAPAAAEGDAATPAQHAAQAPAPLPADPGQAEPEPTAAIVAPGPPAKPGPGMRLIVAGQEDPLEVHPLDERGQPLEPDYELLRQAFACHGRAPEAIDPALLQLMSKIHAQFERPLQILAGRCGDHSDAHDSETHHAAGRAVDVRVRGVATGRLTGWLEEQGVGGVGRYKRAGFVHLDVRADGPTRWSPGSKSRADGDEDGADEDDEGSDVEHEARGAGAQDDDEPEGDVEELDGADGADGEETSAPTPAADDSPQSAARPAVQDHARLAEAAEP